MKQDKIIYWVTTALISLGSLLAVYWYFTDIKIVESYKHFGFPAYFRIQVGISKLVGAIVLIVPFFPAKMKEWAYAGFGILYISAAIIHYMVGDPTANLVVPLINLVILTVSNIYYSKIKNA
ncbi:DoxX family protein [Flectobacillus longus]|uniref:DoxX family protein n=1 Tax=Flectobacillus longus TaxID=2984207 RepID=UPI0024B86E46|nr:DoxX family protein [Flectobacillus longus]MDI9877821.1 DoxX family protein [Flectobacillus longus]